MPTFDIEEPRFAEQQVKDQQEQQGFPDDHGYWMQHGFQCEEKRGERHPNGIKHPVKDDSEQKAAVIEGFFDSGVHIVTFLKCFRIDTLLYIPTSHR